MKSLGWSLIQHDLLLVRREAMQRQICTGKENVKRHKECYVMTDEEIGVLHVPADEHQELLAMLEARREARNRFSLKPSETTWPC